MRKDNQSCNLMVDIRFVEQVHVLSQLVELLWRQESPINYDHSRGLTIAMTQRPAAGA